jgi:hypothetical protein
MEPEHDNTGYVFLFASPPSKWILRTELIGFFWFHGVHSRHATHENRISVHATKTITDAEANFEEAWKREVQSYHKEVKQRVRRLDFAIIYVSGTRFASVRSSTGHQSIIDCLGDYLLFGNLFLFAIGPMSGIHWSL